MTYNGDKHHATGNDDDLCYDVARPEWFSCKLKPNAQVLHVYKLDEQNYGNTFGTKSTNTVTKFFGYSCKVIESEVYNNSGDDDSQRR